MKNAGPPWLGRSDVSGNFRHAARTLASASATSRSENRLTLPLFLAAHTIARWIRDSPTLAARAERSQTVRIRLRSLLVMELFDSLLDDETLIRRPESQVPAVVASHRELRGAYRNLIASLVAVDRRLTEIARQIQPGDSIPVSVLISGGAGGLLALARHEMPGIEIAAVEPTVRDLDDLAGSAARVISAAAGLGPDVAVFIEVPYAPGWEAAVELIEAAGLYGKVVADQAEPRQLAEQLSILIEADLPFKITTASTVECLSLLTAVEGLVAGGSLDDAAELLIRDDPDRIGAALSSWDQTTQSRIRRRVRRLGIDQPQQVITSLTSYLGLPAP